MAQSISQSQAKALADGFLDGLGSSKSELQPRESLSTLIQVAGDLITNAQENLVKADRVASGALSASMKILNPELHGNVVSVDVQALKYWKFVDLGVKGTAGGNGRYAFRNNKVGKNMMTNLRKWIIKEGLKARVDRKYTPINKRAAKRRAITQTSQSVAYAIGVSVKKKGIAPTNFFTSALNKTRQELKQKVGAAFRVDIINSIPNNIDGTNNKA